MTVEGVYVSIVKKDRTVKTIHPQQTVLNPGQSLFFKAVFTQNERKQLQRVAAFATTEKNNPETSYRVHSIKMRHTTERSFQLNGMISEERAIKSKKPQPLFITGILL